MAGTETESQRILLNKSELAAFLNISRPTLYKHLARPDAPEPKGGKYDAFDVAKFVVRQQARDNRGGSEELDVERLLNTKAERRKKEVELAALEGKFVDRTEVVAWIAEIFAGLRQRLLGLPGSLATRLEKKSAKQASKILETAIRKTLEQFSAILEQRSGIPAPIEGKTKPKKQKPKKARKTNKPKKSTRRKRGKR